MRRADPARALRRIRHVLRLVAIVVVLILVLLPIYWMINTSFKLQPEIFRLPPTVVPAEFTFANYAAILAGNLASSIAFLAYFRNSMIVAVATVIVTLLLATPAAYAFSRVPFAGKRTLTFIVLVSQMLPVVLILIPLYRTFLRLGLISTYPGLVIPYLMFTLPFSIWMLKGYFDTLPRELEEAAAIDGASRLTFFVRILLPLSRPALVVTALFSFMSSWNEFILASTFLGRQESFTLPVLLHGYLSANYQDWPHFAAGAIIVSLPVVALFFALQRHLVGGLTAGGVKG
jgi:ABC-type glycerol-3-phosphate transport system permease component